MHTRVDIPNLVYYNDDHTHATSNLPVYIYFRENDVANLPTSKLDRVEMTPVFCSTWQEVCNELNQHPHQVIIHINTLKRLDVTVPEIISMIQTRMIVFGHPIPVGVTIESSTTLAEVRELKRSGVFGIVPSIRHWGTDECIHGIHALRDRIPYWPKHIIDCLPEPPERPLCVYFCEDWVNYVKSVNLPKFLNQLGMDIDFCSSWDEIDTVLMRRPHQIVFHYSMLKRLDVTVEEIMFMMTTRLTLAGLSIPIAVGVDHDTPASIIKQLKQAGVRGIVPSKRDFGIDECVVALHSVSHGQSYWPKHIIERLPGNKPKEIKSGITVTPRQATVLNLIQTRGLTNKQIAQALNISEPTVKMHVSDIMRAYGVKTRVQLAVLS